MGRTFPFAVIRCAPGEQRRAQRGGDALGGSALAKIAPLLEHARLASDEVAPVANTAAALTRTTVVATVRTTKVVLPLADSARRSGDATHERQLPTHVYFPSAVTEPLPLIVFGHGFFGHPRKFTRLLGAWAEAGFVVAAPAFPLTNDEMPGQPVFDDVAEQPADMRFVIDRLLESSVHPIDQARIGVAGFSLGAVTALAVAFHPRHRDRRVRAVASLAGCFWSFGGSFRMTSVPLLVVHGTADETVSYASGREVYDAAEPPKALVSITGGPHELAQDSDGPHPTLSERTLAFWQLTLHGDENAAQGLVARAAAAEIVASGISAGQSDFTR